MRQAAIRAQVLLILAACRTEGADPPTANTDVPALECAEIPAVVVANDHGQSSLSYPIWRERCTRCPVDSATVEPMRGVAEVPAIQAWSRGGACVVQAVTRLDPTVDPWVDPGVDVRTTLSAAAGIASWSETWAAPPGVTGAAVGTFRLPLPAARPVPDHALPIELLPEAPELLLDLRDDGAGAIAVSFGAGNGAGERDLCTATTTFPAAAAEPVPAPAFSLDGAGLVPEGAILRGAILHARPSGPDTLVDVVLVARFDLVGLETTLGLAADELCASIEAAAGTPRCVPCGDPAAGWDGLPTCVTAVFEWPSAARATADLALVSPEDLPASCQGDDDSAAP